MEARVEGAVAAELEAIAQLGEADEDEGQERAAVPLVIEQDVQMVERVLVQEVALVEEEDGVDAVAAEVLHVRRDRVEDGGGRRRRRETEGDAELAVEIAPAEGDVMAVGEAEAGLGRRVRSARRTQVLPTPGSPVRLVGGGERSGRARGVADGVPVTYFKPSARAAGRARMALPARAPPIPSPSRRKPAWRVVNYAAP